MNCIPNIFIRQSRRESSCKLDIRACQAVWYLCTKLDCDKNGIPSQACRIMEQYIAFLVQTGVEYQEILHRMTSQFFLIASGAIWLAAKMSSATAPVSASIIRRALATVQDAGYNVQEITSMEIQLMHALAFYVPLYTISDMAHQLSKAVRMPPEQRGIVYMYATAVMMDSRLYDEAFTYLKNTRNIEEQNRTRIITVDYAAGIVAAVQRMMTNKKTGITHSLAELIGVSVDYVKCVRDTILTEFAITVPSRPQPPYTVANRTRRQTQELMQMGRELWTPESSPELPTRMNLRPRQR